MDSIQTTKGISKSRFCNGVRCPKMVWMEKYAEDKGEEQDNSLVFENGHRVGALAKTWYGDYVEVEFDRDNKPAMIAETASMLEEGYVNICEASFGYDDLFCMVDILHRNDDGSFDMIEVKSSTQVKDLYLWDIAFQYYVLQKSEIEVRKAYCMYINKEYERHGDLDIKDYFTLKDCTDDAIARKEDVQKQLETIKEMLSCEQEPDIEAGEQCSNPYRCDFFNYCNSTADAEDEASDAFNINQETDPDRELSKGLLEEISYPLCFLRMEICNYPIPPFDGLNPYKQIPFQYTLLIQREEDGDVESYEYMPEIETGRIVDPRRVIAESLCENIPEDACVIVCRRGCEAYDKNVEPRMIRNLADSFSDLSDQLNDIKDRCIDLADAFGDDYYYRPSLISDDEEVENTYIYLHEKSADKIEEIRKLWLEYGSHNVHILFNAMSKMTANR